MPRTLFADSFYWIALIFPRDAFHAAVSSFSRALGSVRASRTGRDKPSDDKEVAA